MTSGKMIKINTTPQQQLFMYFEGRYYIKYFFTSFPGNPLAYLLHLSEKLLSRETFLISSLNLLGLLGLSYTLGSSDAIRYARTKSYITVREFK